MLQSSWNLCLCCCSWLYLGGCLSSALTTLLLLRLGSYFLGGRAFAFQAELYGGLLAFMGYVLFDTQVPLSFSGLSCSAHHLHYDDKLKMTSFQAEELRT